MKLSILPGRVVLKGKKKILHTSKFYSKRRVGTQIDDFTKKKKQLRCSSNYITITINSTQVEMNK